MSTDPDLDRLRPVYEDIHGRLWRALLAWSGSTHVADEAVAEAFAQAVRRGDALRDPAAWIWRSAFRIAAGDMARQRRTEPLGDVDPTSTAAFLPAETVDLLAALRQLSDQQRRAVVLVDGAGMTAPEAAAVLDTSPATVRVQLSRARRRLRSLLSDQEDLHDD